MNRDRLMAILPLIVGLFLASPGFGQDSGAKSCADCHDGGKNKTGQSGPPHVLLAESVHADLSCDDCHGSISLDGVDTNLPNPHGEVPPVNCGECHDEAAEVYVKHGRWEVGQDPDLPTCWSCHGAHDVLAPTDTNSRVHPVNLPDTCTACHLDASLLERHEFLRAAPIRLYENSVHGQASKKGRYMAATCNDCHSATDPDGNQTAHRILAANDPQSPIAFFNIPNTCGTCHSTFMNDYWEGIHGKMVKRGGVDSPVCTTCHGEHGIMSASDPRSPVSAARVAEATCSPCHESEVLKEKYGVPVGRLTSYVDSYHGLKSKAGIDYVANCASCHGSHRVLPHIDPTSSIHPDNLRETCGHCHQGISAELAKVPIHETATGIKTGWPNFFRVLYIWLIVVTIV